MSDLDDGLENWQNRLYELHGHRCAQITQSLRCLSAHPRGLPAYVGMTDPGEFIAHVSDRVPQSQNTQTLETALGATAAWGTDPTKSHPCWGAYQKFLRPRFISQTQEVRSKFKRPNSLQGHLRKNYTAWENTPPKEWVHKFVHILDPIAKKGIWRLSSATVL